jgi:diketogulonate reductase-like aldo/keto reductase
MATAIKYFQLNTGAKIPSVGLGTWQAEPGVVAKAITTAIQVSIYLFIYLFIIHMLY